jgi:DNA-binding HxlR family transcriptional regulator
VSRLAYTDGMARLCPRYHHAVELIGRRWTGAIVNVLMRGPARYNELRAEIPDISDKMLAERLKELELEGVLTRTVIPVPPVGVEYQLTEKGRALESAVVAIGKWAEKWVAVPGAAAPAKRTAVRRR